MAETGGWWPAVRETRRVRRLILVYAADSGTLGALVDSARKLFRIQGCALCTITHGLVGEKQEWKTCREELGVPVEALHLDELTPQIESVLDGRVPAVLAETAGGPEMLLKPDVLARCNGSVADFRGRLRTHAAMRGLHIPSVTDRPASGS